MPTPKKEPPRAAINTQNDPTLRVLAALERIAEARDVNNDQVRDQIWILGGIADTLSER